MKFYVCMFVISACMCNIHACCPLTGLHKLDVFMHSTRACVVCVCIYYIHLCVCVCVYIYIYIYVYLHINMRIPTCYIYTHKLMESCSGSPST
jgi:hypothetical protein